MNKFSIFILLLFLNITAFSQNERMTFDHLTINNGLSDGRVDCILQDSYGFLWFGTQDGLNRFDGYNFAVYGHDIFDSTSISSDWIRCIMQDDEGQLWIGTEGGGLNRFNYETESFDQWLQDNDDPTSLNDNFVRALLIDHNGIFWVGTRSGLVIFNKDKESFTAFHTNPLDTNSPVFNENITEILEDRDGNLWLGTSNDVYKINNQRNKLTHYASEGDEKRITSIFQDSFGDIWIGSRYDGIQVHNPYTGSFVPYTNDPSNPSSIVSNEIKDIFEDESENLWIATMHGGLNQYDRKTKSFHAYLADANDPSSLSSNSARIIYQDGSGVIWLGMDGSGIDSFYRNTKKFEFYGTLLNDGTEFINSTVLSIAEDSKGTLWLGTEGEGLVSFSRATQTVSHYVYNVNNSFTISSNQVTCILEDNTGTIWAGTKEGLNKFNIENGMFHRYYVTITPITGNNFINAILQQDEEGLWLGTNGGVIYFEKSTGIFKPVEFDSTGVLDDESVVSICFDKQGILWIGYLRSGLVAFNPVDNSYTHYRADANFSNSLSSNFIQYIFQDSQDRLWIATRKGLNQYNSENDDFIRFDKSDGMPSNVIAGIVEDTNGNLWLSTTNGISKFESNEQKFTNYDVQDGLQGNQFWNRSCFQSKTGELFFGGNNGFNAFFPDYVEKMANPLIPPIVITNINVLNKPLNKSVFPYVQGNDTLRLDFDKNQISLEFAALDYISPEKNQFAYILEGFEQEWNYTGTRRFANYTNLDPGHYTFKVKGSNSDGVWNETGASLNIYIPRPFSRTIWAYLIYGIVGIGLIYGINAYIFALINVKHELKLERLERKKAKEMNQFKLQFFTDIAHEFKTPLTLIQAPLEEMLAANKGDQHKDEMGLMYRNVRYLMRLVQQLLCFRRVEHGKMPLETTKGDLIQFVRRIYELFSETAKKHHIDYELNIDQDTIEGWFDWSKLEEVLVNLIDNAFKYTPDYGYIKVSIENQTENEKSFIMIKVSDTGKGISEEDLPHIFERFYNAKGGYRQGQASSGLGLALSKKFVELHSGTLLVQSSEESGSEFTVKLPFGTDHLAELEMHHVGNGANHLTNLNVSDIEEIWDIREQEFDSNDENDKRTLLLLVEDDPEMRAYLKKQLSKKYDVIDAPDGNMGLELAESRMPSLIISDVVMPGIDGIELCKRLKGEISTSHIPIILLSAKSEVEDKIQGMEFGADDYIEKPFHFRFLDARVTNMLKSRKMLQERYRKELIIEPSQVTPFSHDEKMLVQIRDYIEEHLSDPELGVNHLAYHVGVSRTMMFMKLKELIGYSPQEFIKAVRLKKAAQMLHKTDFTVSEIAYRVGFKYPKYFSTCFQQEYSKTPSEYRESETEIQE